MSSKSKCFVDDIGTSASIFSRDQRIYVYICMRREPEKKERKKEQRFERRSHAYHIVMGIFRRKGGGGFYIE